jgi:hypothetical protein
MQHSVTLSVRERMNLRLEAVPPGVSGKCRLANARLHVNAFVHFAHGCRANFALRVTDS